MKELVIIISSIWKFAATFPVAIIVFKMSFLQTVLYTNIGGITGIALFSMASKGIIHFFDILLPRLFRREKKPKKVFTKGSRRIIRLKSKYGLPGIIILTHILLSIPVGAFLITKYYGRKKLSYLYLFIGQLAWSLIFTLFYTKIKILLPI